MNDKLQQAKHLARVTIESFRPDRFFIAGEGWYETCKYCGSHVSSPNHEIPDDYRVKHSPACPIYNAYKMLKLLS